MDGRYVWRQLLMSAAVILLWTSPCSALILQGNSSISELCQQERASVACPDRQVMIVDEAVYGRMALGRCIEQSYGHIGCQTDVLDRLDQLCSGRQSCGFTVVDLHGGESCPSDLMGYLRMKHTCIEVETCNRRFCESSEYQVRLGEAQGILASRTAWDHGCGSSNCPWLIQAQPGQHINLTLVDFSHMGSRPVAAGNLCQRLATVVDGEVAKDITTCVSEYRRDRSIYMSTTNAIQVEMFSQSTEGFQYLIHYQVVGCPELVVPMFADSEKSGEQVTLKCRASSETWTVVCEGSVWVGDVDKVCPETVSYSDESEDHQTQNKSPYGWLVVVGLGAALGVIIGVVLLAIALYCLRRRSRRRSHGHQNTLLCEQSPARDLHKPGMIIHEGSPLSRGGTLIYTPEHDYTTTLHPKRALPVPSPTVPGEGTEQFQCHECVAAQTGPADYNVNHPSKVMHCKASHLYETPAFAFQPMVLPGGRVRLHSTDALAFNTEAEDSRKST